MKTHLRLRQALLVLCLLWVVSCASMRAPTSSESRVGDIPAPVVTEAVRFNKLVLGQLSADEIKTFRTDCDQTPAPSVFCVSVKHFQELEKRIKRQEPKPSLKMRVEPPDTILPIQWKKGKLQNFDKLRKAEIKDLLATFAKLNPEEILKLSNYTVSQKKCPNNLAAPLAATLEDSFPEKKHVPLITKLYQKGASCAKKGSSDFEHYLTRAGLLSLWTGQNQTALGFFKQVTAHRDLISSRSLFWQYRVEKALGQKTKAKATFEKMVKRFPIAFHSIVAQMENDRDPMQGSLVHQAMVKTRSEKKSSVNPWIEQTEILSKLGFERASYLVADWGLDEARGVEKEVRLYLTLMADARTRIIRVSDLVSDQPQQIDGTVLKLFFPQIYSAVFEGNSDGLNPMLLMSVARQESTFDAQASSQANARGLLQIHPETGKRLSGKDNPDLYDPETNVKLGARYLQELLQRFGKIHLALAAYNAGEDKLAEWIKKHPTDDPLLFVDLISYRETRDYVANVLRNYYWYRRMNGEPKAIAQSVVEPPTTR